MRLPPHDYATPGFYFITACIQDRKCLLGKVCGGLMQQSHFGEIVEACWWELRDRYESIDLDEFIVMPNHVHGIVCLKIPAVSLSEVLRTFKGLSAKRINRMRKTKGTLWQRGFYDHVIRSEAGLQKIRQYIADNPARWHIDRENPDAAGAGLKPAPTQSR